MLIHHSARSQRVPYIELPDVDELAAWRGVAIAIGLTLFKSHTDVTEPLRYALRLFRLFELRDRLLAQLHVAALPLRNRACDVR